jgi:transposase-like protein
MGQVLHGSATTTEAISRAIQHSQASLRALARRYGINPKTIAKRKKRGSVADLPTGPRRPKSTVLSIEEEAIDSTFRHHTLLPLDDCLYALQARIPHLTRSSLHRCLKRHGISRLPQLEGDTPDKRKFKAYPIGYFHIDIAEVRTEEGKLCLFVAVDRTSKFERRKRPGKLSSPGLSFLGSASILPSPREPVRLVPGCRRKYCGPIERALRVADVRWPTMCTQPGDVVAALDTASLDHLRDARKLVIVCRPHQAARSAGADPPGLQNAVAPIPCMTPLMIADTAGMRRCGGASIVDGKASRCGRLVLVITWCAHWRTPPQKKSPARRPTAHTARTHSNQKRAGRLRRKES